MIRAPSCSWQSEFARALLDSDSALPSGVVSHLSTDPRGRFAVYRNNVMVALVGALESRFPVACRIVGADFFRAMARVFATENPPRTPVMMTYGDDFPAFIETFAPAGSVPYLADVARLEAARTRAYHAADAMAVSRDRLVEALEVGSENLGFVLHPSVEILSSPFPIVTIWAMNSGELELAPVDDWSGEDALVLRPALDVEVMRLPRGGVSFLDALRHGSRFGAAVAIAHAATPGFDLAAVLALLLGAGLVVDLRRDMC